MNPKPSYLGAFLKHPNNRVALLACAVAAIFASIPFGWTGLALVGVMGLGTEALAALAIPGLPSFRAWVDGEQHRQGRAERRLSLLNELSSYGDNNALATYQHMVSRVQALYQTAGDRRTTLTRQDVDKLEDLTVDYLGLCVVNLSLKQRKDHASDDLVVKRIAHIQAQLKTPALPEDEMRQLRSALAEYTEVMNRSRRLAVRRSTLEATLLSMPDKMEEVYQLVITSPYSSEMGSKLEESLARLRIAEEVAAEFEDPASYAFGAPPVAQASDARPSRAQAMQRASPRSSTSR
ncbi:MAG: hypothetical protein KJ614_07035 [Gammaproteobacteria bacterium]|uniref:hypothetical protein n=1 Tax=Rhodoferax sp. TaxID=50421 RepID=UPI0017B6E2E1|nr:hypothetical protein [Rhodoferax sp.]MBU3898673.1 hypothetical protein [Gammaproteobacteria bacterium]MBA3057010.1 hypothetical protein [Rhodoferax sp.]MBU3998464.1 hypothetical protein [Gammaproteobacteria bacterium]MBU4019582.1 hypothetical protein [Gammaproteobacteria bacterium]MBU4079096.1 hypothetical protein [Gammaproteobacteria bacterium]